jgi:trk system potassium uptake protein TrkH
MAFFFLTFVGGCTGSTAGGIKIFRFEIMAYIIQRQAHRLIFPHGAFPVMYNARPLTMEVKHSLSLFVFLFIVIMALMTGALALMGLDFITSITGAATAIANVGPGLGNTIGPAGNFASLPDGAKWVLSFGMLVGRLEIMTVLVLLTPWFWRG